MRTDRELLEKARFGDSGAVDELLARHERQVFRFGLRMCGNEEDARDVLQETLLAAFKNVKTFRGDAQLSTWLYQIARSFCLKSRRRGAGEPMSHVALDAPEAQRVESSDAAPDVRAEAHQIGELLQAAILALPEASREVIVLRDVEGLSAEEAATVAGLEVGALKSRLHRARMQLRELLAGTEGVSAAGACPELAQELSAYAAAEIDQATCANIEEHLRRCARCTDACAALRTAASLCRQIPGDEVPEPVRAAVRQALRKAIAPGAVPLTEHRHA
jgi:RNA polymerase sigma-70 factor, ECF subfamily